MYEGDAAVKPGYISHLVYPNPLTYGKEKSTPAISSGSSTFYSSFTFFFLTAIMTHILQSHLKYFGRARMQEHSFLQ